MELEQVRLSDLIEEFDPVLATAEADTRSINFYGQSLALAEENSWELAQEEALLILEESLLLLTE
jgi:hypothetical protein